MADEEFLVAYVHNVSPMKKANSNSNLIYYNMMLQTQNETHRSVSYREDLREQMVDIAKQKSPIKIKTLKERLIFSTNLKRILNSTRQSNLKN